MPIPDMTVVAEGDLPSGEHWILTAGGTAEDYYTFLETVHSDGHRDEGGSGRHLCSYHAGRRRAGGVAPPAPRLSGEWTS